MSNKATGALISSSSELGDQQKFKIVIVNRPQLVLKSEFGFVGTGNKGQYTCSKAKYDVLSVESTKRDTYNLKGEIINSILFIHVILLIKNIIDGLKIKIACY